MFLCTFTNIQVDAKLNIISSCNYDGSGRHLVLHSTEYLRHPFSITTFEDVVYWTDWDREAVFKANKFTGKDIEAVTATHMVLFLIIICCNMSCINLTFPTLLPLNIVTASDDNSRVSSISTTWWWELLPSCKRSLLTSLSTCTACQREKSTNFLCMSDGLEVNGWWIDVCRRW